MIKNKSFLFILLFFLIITSCATYECNFKIYKNGLSKDEIVTISIDKKSNIKIGRIDDKDCMCSNKIRIDPGVHTLILDHLSDRVRSSIWKNKYWGVYRISLLTGEFKSGRSYILKSEKFEERKPDVYDFPGEDVSFSIIHAWIEDSINGEVIGETFFDRESSANLIKKFNYELADDRFKNQWKKYTIFGSSIK